MFNDTEPSDPSFAPMPVSIQAEFHPNQPLDPWWMNQALALGLREFIYCGWHTDLDPSRVAEVLPEDMEVVFRATLVNVDAITAPWKSLLEEAMSVGADHEDPFQLVTQLQRFT